MKTWHKVIAAAVVLVVAWFVYKWATRPGGLTATRADGSQTGSVVSLDPLTNADALSSLPFGNVIGAALGNTTPTDASNMTKTADTSNATPQQMPIVISPEDAGDVPL